MSLICALFECRKKFTPTNRRQRFCSGRCRAAASYLPAKRANEAKRRMSLPLKNAKFKELNRDRSLGFDGRYGGPANLNYTTDSFMEKNKNDGTLNPIGD